jgi:hypothetical protein
MSSNLIDIISKSSTNYIHNLSTLKSKKINFSNLNNTQKGNNSYTFDRNKEENFTNSGSFYDLIKKKKSTNKNYNSNPNTNKEISKIKYY